MIPEDFIGQAKRIRDKKPYVEAAHRLGCEVAAIQAVAEVESAGEPFLPSGRPVILFEAHVFSRKTQRRFDDQYPKISSTRWDKSLYGASGEHQYERLHKAMELDREAALASCSWGRFQIMGFNARTCGHVDVEHFVEAHCHGEGAHLRAFVHFIENMDLARHLRSHNWEAFARKYNGSGYAANRYDLKMAAAYDRFSSRVRVDGVKSLQFALVELGYNPGPVDDIWGPRTLGGVRAFLRANGLGISPEPGRPLYAAVQAAARERSRALNARTTTS